MGKRSYARKIMDNREAETILKLLANGINPVTGEILPDESPYNHPSVIRALFSLLETTRSRNTSARLSTSEKQAQNQADGKPRNAGLPWTDASRREVASKFKTTCQLPSSQITSKEPRERSLLS